MLYQYIILAPLLFSIVSGSTITIERVQKGGVKAKFYLGGIDTAFSKLEYEVVDKSDVAFALKKWVKAGGASSRDVSTAQGSAAMGKFSVTNVGEDRKTNAICTLQRRKVEGVKADVDYTFQIRPDASFVNYCGIPKDVGVEIECYLDGGKQSTCDPW